MATYIFPVSEQSCPYLILWHTDLSFTLGTAVTAWAFLPAQASFAPSRSCTSSAIYFTIAGFSSWPPSLIPHPSYPPISSLPSPPQPLTVGDHFWAAAAGSEGEEEKLAEENHLGQPQASTVSPKPGYLKCRALRLYQSKLIFLKPVRLRWISRVTKALVLPNFKLFFSTMGPSGLSKEEVAFFFFFLI